MFKSKNWYRFRVEELELSALKADNHRDSSLELLREVARVKRRAESQKDYNEKVIENLVNECTLLEAENKALKDKLQTACIEGSNGVVLKGSPEEVANFIHFLRQ